MILLDTNAVLAIMDEQDPDHARVCKYIGQNLIVPMSILAEVDYFATKYIGAFAARAFLKSLETGELPVLGFEPNDLERTNQIMERYPSVPLGFVDASLVALAERFRIQKILTLDRRHFSLVKPLGIPFFELLPE